MTYINFAGVNVPLDWRHDPDRREAWNAHLEREHARLEALPTDRKREHTTRCGCRDGMLDGKDARPLLTVRRYVTDDIAHFALARYPRTGLTHDPMCSFFGTDEEDDRRAPGVLKKRDDGRLGIRLETSLNPQRPRDPKPDEVVDDRDRKRGQPPMSPRGLLELLWETARYQTWNPRFAGKRTFHTLAWHLSEAARSVVVGRVSLDARLIVMDPYPRQEHVEAAQRTWDAALAAGGSVIVVAELSELGEPEPNKHTTTMYLRGGRKMYGIVVAIRREQIEALRRSFAAELTAKTGNADDDTLIALVQVKPESRPGADRFGRLIDGCIMRITKHFIPVASGHERRVALALVDAGRAFIKPLRLGGADLLPDFILTDTADFTPMEVFGMVTAEYVARREEKRRLYPDYYRAPLWEWDASRTREIPPFPKPLFRRASATVPPA